MLPSIVNDIAAVASIVSLAVSLWVAVEVRALAHLYKQIALIPRLARQCTTCIKNLESLIQEKNWQEVQKQAAKALALMTEAKTITDGDAHAAATKASLACERITIVASARYSGENSSELILSLVMVHTHLEYLSEHKKWR